MRSNIWSFYISILVIYVIYDMPEPRQFTSVALTGDGSDSQKPFPFEQKERAEALDLLGFVT